MPLNVLHSYLPSIYNLIHCQKEPLHILQQSPPLYIFSKEEELIKISVKA